MDFSQKQCESFGNFDTPIQNSHMSTLKRDHLIKRKKHRLPFPSCFVGELAVAGVPGEYFNGEVPHELVMLAGCGP